VSDCWNEIGVYGNHSCSKLKEFTHCRNCAVYSAAGVQLLDRPLPAGYRGEWAAHFARPKPENEPGNLSAVVYRLGDEWMALPSQAMQEVAEWRPIHSLPHRQHGLVLGLVNLRGELLIAISLGRLLGLEPASPPPQLRTRYRRLLVAAWNSDRFAFPADDVLGPHRFQVQALKPAPAAVGKGRQSYIQGVLTWQNHAVGLMDVALLFSNLNQALG